MRRRRRTAFTAPINVASLEAPTPRAWSEVEGPPRCRPSFSPSCALGCRVSEAFGARSRIPR
eukprot:1405843-Pyramimonas_sp.AAC.1